MAQITYHNVGITAMSACVPQNIYHNRDLGYLIPEEEIEKTIQSIGIEERRIADEDVCASDLCFAAARQLMTDNGIAPDSIDVLLFVSQTNDYRVPFTAPSLQRRLGLSKETACLDISLGCSGFVYALSTAFAYCMMEGVRRVLLLDGETFSKIVSRRDKVDWPLYGDAGTATLIEKGDFPDATFLLHSDGSGEDAVKIRGGMRHKIVPESCIEKEEEDGNFRSDLQVYMDGMDVFNFALRSVPKDIKQIVKLTGVTYDDIDYLVFHQANKFMTDFFVKKLKFDPDKVPYCIQKYGNTSSASVPLTIVSELQGKMDGEKTLIMAGYGSGFSWVTAKVTFRDCHLSPVIEYEGEKHTLESDKI